MDMITKFLVLFFGVLLVYIAIEKSTRPCPQPSVQYRFIPRTFKEDQDNPVKPSEIFSDMFNKTGWVAGFSGKNVTKDTINSKHISQ